MFKSFLQKIIPKKYYPLALRIYYKIRGLRAYFYLGNRVTCPICNWHFRKFLSFKTRRNAQCPRCGSLERHRLLWLFLKDRTNFFSSKLRVLDIAPRQFSHLKFKNLPNLDYIGADISHPLSMVMLNIEEIPFASNRFDCIICYHVLEHVHRDREAMQELFRVLKPGGWAILQSPVDNSLAETYEDASITSPAERKIAFGQEDHLRLYGRDYKERLAEAGFDVSLVHYAESLSDNEIKKYGILKNEVIYLCNKS